MLKDKKVIIFDMDGTLIDSVGIWNAVDQALIGKIRRDGRTETENIQLQRDTALRTFRGADNPYLAYCGLLKERYHALQEPEEILSLRHEISLDFLRYTVDYKKDADILIRTLKQAGYTLVIATTTNRSNMKVYRTENLKIKSKADIDQYFTLIYTREDARQIKPHPEIYLRVLKELEVAPEECLVFEDSLSGIEAAASAGIQTVAVYDSYSDADRARICELSTYQINHYAELLRP